MDRLAAAYRVEVPVKTRAAYWLALQQTDAARFNRAVELAIDSEAAFPTVATLKDLLRQSRAAAPPAPALGSGTVGCLTCFDAGWVLDDKVPVGTDQRLIRCPRCRGNANVSHNSHATVLAHIEREHDRTARMREARSFEAFAADTGPRDQPPPEGFARNVPIPETERERMVAETKARIAREVAGISERMRTMRDREGTR